MPMRQGRPQGQTQHPAGDKRDHVPADRAAWNAERAGGKDDEERIDEGRRGEEDPEQEKSSVIAVGERLGDAAQGQGR